MKIKLIDKWKDEVNGTEGRYCELRIGTGEACCVKLREDGLRYVLECYDGNEVYSWIGGADFPLRKLTRDEENEILAFVDKVFETKFV